MYKTNFIELEKKEYMFTPWPVKCTTIIYIDYIQQGKELLVLNRLKKIITKCKCKVFLKENENKTAVVLLTLNQADYKNVKGMIENLPTKINIIYGKKEYDDYLEKCSQILDYISN